MDIDSMVEKVAEVSLEDESIEIDIIPGESTNETWDLRWALVGRFVGERFIRLHEMSQIMASNWRPGMGVSILEISPQRFLFQFAHEADIRRIVEGGPWAYENHLLVYERVADGVNPVDVSLEKAAFWIQLHYMPLGYISDNVVKRIGSKLGDIMEIDPNNFTGVSKEYLRLRVMLDITKPLKDHVVLKIRNGGAVQHHKVILKFERLPTFCFRCGLIGHGERFCRRNYEADNGEVPRMFGPDLRDQRRRNKKLMISDRWLIQKPLLKRAVPGHTSAAGWTSGANFHETNKVSSDDVGDNVDSGIVGEK